MLTHENMPSADQKFTIVPVVVLPGSVIQLLFVRKKRKMIARPVIFFTKHPHLPAKG